MTTPAFAITLTMKDLSTKQAKVAVRKLPQIIHWKGVYFSKQGETYYKQVSGEDLSNIEV